MTETAMAKIVCINVLIILDVLYISAIHFSPLKC